MKACRSCKTQLAEQVTTCPECGRSVIEHGSADAGVRLHHLINEANILRIRRDFGGAVDKCTEAIQIEPNNPEVHSLLGDIYASQGNLKEAARWYEIAIELRPECAVDVNKLGRVKTRLSRTGSGGDAPGDGYSGDGAKSDKTESSLKYFIVVCAAAVLLAVLAGFWSVRTDTRRGSVPDVPLVNPANSHRPIDTTPPPPPSTSVHPDEEQKMLYQLVTNADVTRRRITVEDVRLDPRNGSVIVTFWNSKATGVWKPDAVVADAATVAASAFRADKEAKLVTTRCIVHTDAGDSRLAFVADFGRQIADVDLSKQEFILPPNVLRNVWWSRNTNQ